MDKDPEWQRKLDTYPSLRKFQEMGDDYVEWNDGREQALLTSIRNRPDYATLKDNPSLILAAIDDFSFKQDFLISIGAEKSGHLTTLLETQRPKTLVELGGYLGYSAIFFGEKLRAVHGQENLKRPLIWSIEADPKFADIARELIELAGLSNVVKVITGLSDDVLKTLTSEHGIEAIDWLFLDHVEDLYLRDFKLAKDELGLLKPGALVVADNVVTPGAPEYVQYVRSATGVESHGIKCLIMPGEIKDEIEVTKIL